MSLQSGLDALKSGNYQEAIELLEDFCRGESAGTSDYAKAQMGLIKAYQRVGQVEQAMTLCQQLMHSENSQVSEWAKLTYQSLNSL